MSAFCVFGVTKQDCIKTARKKVKNYIVIDMRTIYLTMEDLNVKVQSMADDLFTTERVKQISPAFDAPKFAREWVEVGKQTKQITRPKIMCKGEKVDAKGAPMIRKGQPVIGWIPYAE